MKRTLLTVTLTTAAAAVAVTGASARLGARARPAKATPFKVKLHVTSEIVVHDGHPGTATSKTSTGDSLTLVATLSQGGKITGREDDYCVITAPGTGVCTSVDRFAHGAIVHTGAYSLNGSTFLDAITGGTGSYTGARGTVLAVFRTASTAIQTYQIAP